MERLYAIRLQSVLLGVFLLFAVTTELLSWIGARRRTRAELNKEEAAEIGTLAGAVLGLLALLLGFSFSLALARFHDRRAQVLEEANAIGTVANYAAMLPQPEQGRILHLLRDYTAVRVGLGVPFDPAKLLHDVDRSARLQQQLWQQANAVTATAPQSLPVHRFVAALNEMTNIAEARLTALRNHVPAAVLLTLIGVAEVALGFTGYHAGLTGHRRRIALLVVALTVACVIALVVDLDRPARGLVEVPIQPLIDAAQDIPP